MSDKEIATDCKNEFELTAIVKCTVRGVDYAPGKTFRTDKSARDFLMSVGAVMEESTSSDAEVALAAVVPTAATPHPMRVTRKSKK